MPTAFSLAAFSGHGHEQIALDGLASIGRIYRCNQEGCMLVLPADSGQLRGRCGRQGSQMTRRLSWLRFRRLGVVAVWCARQCVSPLRRDRARRAALVSSGFAVRLWWIPLFGLHFPSGRTRRRVARAFRRLQSAFPENAPPSAGRCRCRPRGRRSPDGSLIEGSLHRRPSSARRVLAHRRRTTLVLLGSCDLTEIDRHRRHRSW